MTRITFEIGCEDDRCGACRFRSCYIGGGWACLMFNLYVLSTVEGELLRCIPCINAERMEKGLEPIKDPDDEPDPFG